MSVGASQAAALRALLTGDFKQHELLTRELDDDGMRDYVALVSAAFLKMVDRRFGGENIPAAVIDYVGQVRALNDTAAGTIAPDVAERVILAALGHGALNGVSGSEARHVQNLLLPLMVRDEQLDGAGIEAFLKSARQLAQA